MYIQSSDPAYIAKIKASIENAYLLCHEFDTKNGHFAKTGSGQTERKHSKKKDVFFAYRRVSTTQSPTVASR
jgi:hypothetical protein